MKDDVRLIFSFISRQMEMEGGAQEVGGWALHYRDQQGLKEEGTGKLPSIVGRKILWKRLGERELPGCCIRNKGIWEPRCMRPSP